eukprot:10600061-Lingulodinium_polyedra.AAC.1
MDLRGLAALQGPRVLQPRGACNRSQSVTLLSGLGVATAAVADQRAVALAEAVARDDELGLLGRSLGPLLLLDPLR